MKVLVAGANGHTGRLLIEHLANHSDHHPYALVRDEDQAKELRKLGAAEVIVADLEDFQIELTKGMDAVIFAAGSGSKTGPDKTIAVDQEGAKKLVDAAFRSGVKHFVMLSAMGADEPQGPIEHYLAAKQIADDYLKNSGLTYTIVRPGLLSHDAPTGKIELATKIELLEDRAIPRADVAHVLAATLDIENTHNKVFEILSGDKKIEQALDIF
ncbi:SDR family oxidoreductase [Lederbergia lenta]|uniref:NAD dependent epimerase/dehydratase n=1 Tax=Lederbergia lenta TaxID=1467 RepID=A0A2X4W2W8_LEDLE|nr:SDR family oxidoreductase [Lederbergia lenta]MCM3112303.1 SDR family oxidoreductase [Lederbergia lenta]MEC2326523.1 SDR family oxidoreductase [Lederbergia lenta]SQI53232.1 NAD dependent epimerase/dehydratase [Lederbergia lenta]